ncbi:NAD(P)H-dependent glycerol-3-phosphate dehydrogenase [Candidatus Nomurabacteria bacterium]|nr:NAD(P)H-dependent glycerol-3-phosphate dehydrogenase [Candidatus Nomurabacteria bacterium]
MKVTVIGAGSMGTAMAHMAAKNGNDVVIWNWHGDLDPLDQIKQSRENTKYMPGFAVHQGVTPEKDLQAALKDSQIVLFVVPSSVIAATMQQAQPFVSANAILVDLSKGVEPQTHELIPHIMEKLFPQNAHVAMSGPAVAIDIMKGYFTAMDLASNDAGAVQVVKEALSGKSLSFQINDDIIGTEFGGAFKNVYAIALGVCDGLGYGLNTKAALLTHAMQEMGMLIETMGGRRETVFGLSGLGDLIGTALSDHSRNRRFGQYIGEGMTLEEAAEKVGQVVEGVNATKALMAFAQDHGVSVPLARIVQSILDGTDPTHALQKYLQSE